MITWVLILCGFSVMVMGMAIGVCLHSENFGGVLACSFTAFVVLSIMGIINNDFHERVETLGTYPDTTITITKGVCDTTVIYKVYEHH